MRRSRAFPESSPSSLVPVAILRMASYEPRNGVPSVTTLSDAGAAAGGAPDAPCEKALDVPRDDQSAHRMADQRHGRAGAKRFVVPVVLHEQRPADDLAHERGQPLLGPVQRHAPVVAEGEHGHGARLVFREPVAQLFDEVLVDERKRTAWHDPGRFAQLVALVLRVERDPVVAAPEHGGPDGLGRQLVLVVEVGGGDPGNDDDWGYGHGAKRCLMLS